MTAAEEPQQENSNVMFMYELYLKLGGITRVQHISLYLRERLVVQDFDILAERRGRSEFHMDVYPAKLALFERRNGQLVRVDVENHPSSRLVMDAPRN